MPPIKYRKQPYQFEFKKIIGFNEARQIRRFETKDIVKRLGVISPNRVFINNYPANTPPVIFNPSLTIDDDIARIYARIVVGYYKYVSGIVELEIPLDDITSGNVNINYYASRIVIYPSTKYDLWGAEDPRTYRIGETTYMTYTGRSINYFNPHIRVERTLPVTAVREEIDEYKWRKVFVHKLPEELESKMVSNKDAFLVAINGKKYFFHRPHMIDENYYLLIGVEGKREKSDDLVEIIVEDNIEVMRPIRKEEKLGWSSPPIILGKNKIVTLVHGVDRIIGAYRVLAVEIQFSGKEPVLSAVTPVYIMEPRESYEVFGDRPYTIFPCGLWRLDGNELLITYGAGDSMIGFGKIDLDELIGLLDKGRIY